MNDSVFDYHINKVIPNTILANKEFFLQNIIREPKNMDYFITKDTYKKACNKMGLEVSNISCNFTANVINGFFVVFGEFLENNNIKAIAFATKNNTIRYFTYDEKNMSATYVRYPERSELNPEIKEALIVEFYNRS